MSTKATISVRPVQIIGHKFSDGESIFETASLMPVSAWGIFVDHAEGSMSGLAYDRASALTAAARMAEENGWEIVHLAPEGAGLQAGGNLQ